MMSRLILADIISSSKSSQIKMQHYEFKVSGMSCNHCVNAIEQALTDVDPQAKVRVDLAKGLVFVESAQAEQPLREAIVEAGYVVP